VVNPHGFKAVYFYLWFFKNNLKTSKKKKKKNQNPNIKTIFKKLKALKSHNELWEKQVQSSPLLPRSEGAEGQGMRRL
jgi:hypothetical protein